MTARLHGTGKVTKKHYMYTRTQHRYDLQVYKQGHIIQSRKDTYTHVEPKEKLFESNNPA